MGEEKRNKIARIFPRKTNATPTDKLVFFDYPPMFLPKIDEIHISVCFTWDLQRAEFLYQAWKNIAPIKLGGPAFNQKSGEFEPGLYLKKGYTITSRGCNNKCWFCSVWKREPNLKELKIKAGHNILDDNLLACSKQHIIKVFEMLRNQSIPIQFTGGLEAKLLNNWHIDLLKTIKIGQMFFAYDTSDDYEPLVQAIKKLRRAGYKRQKLRTYVLIGYPNDTISNAEKRLIEVLKLGSFPMAMLFRDKDTEPNLNWKRFQKQWARPAAIYGIMRKLKVNVA